MTYRVEVLDPETGGFVHLHTTEYSVRVISDQFVEKVVFETDDPEFNG